MSSLWDFWTLEGGILDKFFDDLQPFPAALLTSMEVFGLFPLIWQEEYWQWTPLSHHDHILAREESMEGVLWDLISMNFLRNWVVCSDQKVRHLCFSGCHIKGTKSALTVKHSGSEELNIISRRFTAILYDLMNQSNPSCSCLTRLIISCTF